MPESLEKLVNTVIIGASAGGIAAIRTILSGLHSLGSCRLIIVLHRMKNVESQLHELFQRFTPIPCLEVSDKMEAEFGKIYIAPANYHLLFEKEGSFCLEADYRVNHSRPSIDVSFESAAFAFGPAVCGILLSGANEDGALGLKHIASRDGSIIVQDPSEAEFSKMPLSGLKVNPDSAVMQLNEIINYLNFIQ
jgi:two-component system, chemotaxis family, protein-glutamate methylesterase/glutaminase